MTSRVTTLLLGSLVLATVLSACANPTPNGPGGEPSAETPSAVAGASDNKDAKAMTVVIRMMDAQDKFFREQILRKFEQEKGVKLNVVVFDKEDDLPKMLKLEQESGRHTIGLVKTMDTLVNPLIDGQYMLPLKAVVPDAQLKTDLTDYEEAALSFGTRNGTAYYIPRKLETNAMLYLKSKVADAAKHWQTFEPQLNAAIKQQNGYGLPKGFTVEADPNQWDWYDLAAVGYYWANTEEHGVKTGRIAHRSKKDEGTTNEIFTKVLAAGGKPEDMLTGDTPAVTDTLAWEGLQKELNIYNSRMFTEAWAGGDIWKGFAEGQVYLSFMHQTDAFFVHGGSDPTMQGYLTSPDDMGLAIMPRGVSLEMKPDGTPARTGSHASNASGWWWGIPTTSPDPKLSYELARFITNYENHLAESQTFGMMPIRKDVLGKVDTTFDEPWMRDVFNTARAQYQAGAFPKPTIQTWPQLSNEWLEAWTDVVGSGKYLNNGRIDPATIKTAMKPHVAKIKTLSGAR